jgi:hypothetical protein
MTLDGTEDHSLTNASSTAVRRPAGGELQCRDCRRYEWVGRCEHRKTCGIPHRINISRQAGLVFRLPESRIG